MEGFNELFDLSLLLLHDGLCYVRIGFMMRLNDFDFNQSDCHSAEKIPLKFCHVVSPPF